MREHQLLRDSQNDERTFGKWVNDGGQVECDILEPPPNHVMPDRCCVPAGRYIYRARYSPSHKAMVYGLEDVPGFHDVEVHIGNDVRDTLACQLTGAPRGRITVADVTYDAVLHSTVTFEKWMAARGCPEWRTLDSPEKVAAWAEANPDAAAFACTVIDPA